MLQIFAIDLKTDERFEIDDLYWFEENFVHDFGGEGIWAKYAFEIFVGGIMIYPPNTTSRENLMDLKYSNEKEFLLRLKIYIEEMEELVAYQIDVRRGGKTLKELIKNEKMPKIYYEILEKIRVEEEKKGDGY